MWLDGTAQAQSSVKMIWAFILFLLSKILKAVVSRLMDQLVYLYNASQIHCLLVFS